MRFKDIELKYKLNYNSIRNIISSYRKTGRTDKKDFKLPKRGVKTSAATGKHAKNNKKIYDANENTVDRDSAQADNDDMDNERDDFIFLR